MDRPSGELVAAWRTGDQDAAAELFSRFSSRLIALVRTRLSNQFAKRIEPEDVVMSACRSFFIAAREGRFEVRPDGDLWPLLVGITLHKLYNEVKKNSRQKRETAREEGFGSEESLFGLQAEALARGPSPVEAAVLADELERVGRLLTPLQHSVMLMRLQGYGLEEIAVEVRCSRRTVIRCLDRIKELLENRSSEMPPEDGR
jgi:DNA-directed RNA polymerase specialized sigma24 family protein